VNECKTFSFIYKVAFIIVPIEQNICAVF